MARFVRCLRRTLFSNSSPSIAHRSPRIGLPTNLNPKILISRRCLSSGSYVSEMQKSAFQGNILRLIRNEIEYELDHSPPLQPPNSFGPFTVDERPGEQWISLKRNFGDKEDIKIEATMFDRSVPTSKSTKTEPEYILHITFIVNISKAGATEALEIMCSAWPDTIEISKLCIRRGINTSPSSYGGPEFEELDDQLQDALYQFLEERGISDELAVFLHRYMKNKGKAEYVRWMESVKSYVEQK
ncbi:putative mitochondrial glycoprotein [Arabidopsis thaliana]|uniref:Mitochondrial glycoprotein family protein n=7 Tax=Arabidopsis TaxID=3701 RepID=A0A384KGK5_ARATH|nr:Mitochondrial glycoprotein family protein [Arabidopsis thaliana]KAG7652610.1 Mitochondrial glycoprotein superfamily [Arabidopsis thaliana x Arabidopsis arenosa]KAG7660292.1 Mitochondrial glycoprotein superfamily [Arabidopsis suecica]ANM57729.1 Mitochondrial glycoprotein family protein [Arabidopsis thaliana]OAP12240.1 hypothetical protein AXX17_AT1G75590 [Arabidopsis thaliana]CAA0344833.1 unnamed protein product [Arabidopsis thaliana]|eukprot:NP_001320214.1 Mitochondrial glycoprotein family protein [Arabidopsis thaliana]